MCNSRQQYSLPLHYFKFGSNTLWFLPPEFIITTEWVHMLQDVQYQNERDPENSKDGGFTECKLIKKLLEATQAE